MKNIVRKLSRSGHIKVFGFALWAFVVLALVFSLRGVFGSEEFSKVDVFGENYVSKDVGLAQGTFTFNAKNPLSDRTAKITYTFEEFSNGIRDYVVEYKVPKSIPVYNTTLVCEEKVEVNESVSLVNCVEDGGIIKYNDAWVGQENNQELVLQPLEEKEVRITAWWKESALKKKVKIDVVPHFSYEKDGGVEKLSRTEWTLWESDDDSLIWWERCEDGTWDNDATGAGAPVASLTNVGDTVVVDGGHGTDGKLCDFDSNDDLTYANGHYWMEEGGSWTVSFWGNVTNDQDDASMSTGGSGDNGIFIRMADTSTNLFARYNHDGPGSQTSLTGGSVDWSAVALTYATVTYDIVTNNLTLYINGLSVASTIGSGLQNHTSNTFYFNSEYGADVKATNRDEFTFWNKTLTGEDVWDLYDHDGVPLLPNTAPIIKNNVTTISPSGSTTSDFDLTCTFTPLDEDEYEPETLTAAVHWFKDNAFQFENNVAATNDTEVSFILHHDNTTDSDVWFCNASAYDGIHRSDWINSSNVTIEAVANKTDFTDTVLQSNNVKDVFVYDASRESWNRSNEDASWYKNSTGEDFPDKVYLFLTDAGLDIVDDSDKEIWMNFSGDPDYAIYANDFTSVYALDGKIYVGSDQGLYVLDFENDNLTRYDYNNGLAYNDTEPFSNTTRNTHVTYDAIDGSKTLADDDVNDVHANRVRGKHFVGVATDSGVNIINIDDESIAELKFSKTPATAYDSDNVFIADDGTLYYSENEISQDESKTKLSFEYNIDTYTGSSSEPSGSYWSKGIQSGHPHFLGGKINNIYVTFYTSRRHTNHNTIYIGTEKGISVIQEFQGDEGIGVSKSYSYTGSSEDVDYKILEGSTDNVTAVTARSDGNAMYVGTNDGSGVGSVSKISLNSNTLVDSWNTTTDTAIVGNDTTSLDFLDGDLLIGTLDSGATQVVESELDHYLIADNARHRVVEIDSTGLIHFEFGVYDTIGSDSTHLYNPTDAARLVNGNTLIADYGNKRILEVDPDGAVVQEIGNATQLSDATYLDGVYSIKKV